MTGANKVEMQLDQLLEILSRGEEEESEATQLMVEAGAPRHRASYARPTLPNLAPAAPLGGTSGAKKGGARGVYKTGAKTGTAKTATAGAAKKGGAKRG